MSSIFEQELGITQTRDSETPQAAVSSNILDFSQYKGRDLLTVGYPEITSANILDVIDSIDTVFNNNRTQATFLKDYYKGTQEIINRTKAVRPEINNRLVENRAKAIVDFYLGYQCGDGIFYTSRALDEQRNGQATGISEEVDENVTAAIARMNSINKQVGKNLADAEHLLDVLITGRGFRFAQASGDSEEDSDYPYEVFALDATASDMIYSSGAVPRPLAYVYFSEVLDAEGEKVERYTFYTATETIVLDDLNINSELSGTHTLGVIPVVETRLNRDRIGIFESVLPLLEAINVVQSDRLNGLEQFIQAIMVLENLDLDESQVAALRDSGTIKFRSTSERNSSIKYLTNDLNQAGAQTLKNDLLAAVNELTAMPSRDPIGGGTGDTGAAVELRDGWASAEARAKSFDPFIYSSERKLVKLLSICYNIGEGKGEELSPTSIEVKYNRSPRVDRYTSVQALAEEIRIGIDPAIAIKGSNIYDDPQMVADASHEAIVRIRDIVLDKRENSTNTDESERTDQTQTKQTRKDGLDEQV